MPAVLFGLNAAKSSATASKTAPVKRKAVFGDAAEEEAASDEDDESPAFANLAKKNKNHISSKKPLVSSSLSSSSSLKSKPRKLLGVAIPLTDENDNNSSHEDDQQHTTSRPAKSPKLSHSATTETSSNKYSNLSALRNAQIQASKVAEVDSSVYDYDAAYDSFSSAAKGAKHGSKDSTTAASTGPKYMNNLLASSEQRKRDQLRAREKALQREREQEGDEFADKDKFVTSAYKKQQEELRIQEEDEQRRLREEELKRAKGEGMLDFRKNLLRKDEERQKAIEEAAAAAKQKAAGQTGNDTNITNDADNDDGITLDQNKIARELNEKGARIVINDDGEVVDKRQLLSAGLNVARKPPSAHNSSGAGAAPQTTASRASTHGDSSRVSHARNAREAQRERQTRMMERQLEEMAEKAEQAAKAEEKELQEKNKSRITDDAKMDAKARYLARKREREEAEAAKKKKNDATSS